MARRDRFHSFEGLAYAASECVDYRIRISPTRHRIAVIAPHGGGIEPGTSEVAQAIAGGTLSLYCFEGLKRTWNNLLHITSTRFDEPRCQELIRTTEIVVAVHGCEDEVAKVYVGGLHSQLRAQIIVALAEAGFNVADDDTHHGGANPRNICNRGLAQRGVQLELSTGLRRRMFSGLSRKRRTKTTAVFSDFTRAVRKVLIDWA